jgi:hypothetical protein
MKEVRDETARILEGATLASVNRAVGIPRRRQRPRKRR